MNKKKRILILNGQYLPGYKGGGPIQSCCNMIENLSDKFEFYVVTSDRDFKSKLPYENVEINSWNNVGRAHVYYMSPKKQTLIGFDKILRSIEFDTIYLNGFFSPIFTIKPLILKKFGRLKGKKVILTPRGDFTGGCENKKLKKYLYIFFCKIIGLYNNLVWHATSELEENDINKVFKNSKVTMIENLSAKYNNGIYDIRKIRGELRLLFISRISPKKNLKCALEILSKIKVGNVVFDIYGPLEDREYWNECEAIIKNIPSNVKVEYKGEVEHSNISSIFKRYHGFLFPTLGENYGHVIVEAMMNKCIPIVSKGVTPWDEYGEILGTFSELNDLEKFREILNEFINMNECEYLYKLKESEEYVKRKFNNSDIINKYIDFFYKN